jgi:hypothetical protein
VYRDWAAGWTRRIGFDLQQEKHILLLFIASRPAVGSSSSTMGTEGCFTWDKAAGA